MSDERDCPTCGGALPPDAPEGTCPKCLLAAGFESADGAGASDAPDLAEVARQFPDLEILEVLGRGGMGVVYKVRQKRLDRFAALKILPREIVESAPDAARFEDRFTREARALARLSHPNIVAVHEFGEREGMYFFLMEYVDGANLRQAMRAGRLAPAEALAIVPQICDALQYAHDQGVVHRDIKPENVLLDGQGRVKIADFGLAKLVTRAADDRTLTRQGLVMGTPHYMAPEQLEKPSEVDHRADIYSLGVVLYEMLTGELPIGRFAAPSEKVSVDVRLDEVVLRSLEKERDRRYQAVSEVKTGIGAVDLSAAPPAGEHGHPVRPGSRSSKLAFWGLMLPLVAIVGGVALAFVGALLGGDGPDTWRGGGVTMMILGSLIGVTVLVGIGMSIAALVRIKRSGGRLQGTGLAVAGLVLPLFCCAPGAGLPFLFLTRAGPAQGGANPGVASSDIADMELPPAPPIAGPSSKPAEDLGDFRIEITLGEGEAALERQRIPLRGLVALPLNAHVSTSSEATWPPLPGTLIHLRGFQRRAFVIDADARLLQGDQLLAMPGRGPGSWQTLDAYVETDRLDELTVEFDGGEAQTVVVFGRVVRIEER